MNKQKHDNGLRRQCMSLPGLCAAQIEGIQKGLAAAIGTEEIKKIRNVVVTGCGDSYLAARACLPAFKKYNNAFGNNFVAMRCIDVARHYTFKPADNEATLVVGVSASGNAARVKEALLRAKANGCKTLIVTNNPASQAAEAAEYKLIVNTPSFPEKGPGLRNYYASLIGLYALAAYMGQAKGLAPKNALDELFAAITTHTAAYAAVLEPIDDAMFALALQWQTFPAFETIGDDIDFSTAYFIAAKLVETAGIMSPTNDSENWCHVNYFAANAQTIGTIVVADTRENNHSRIVETVFQAAGVGRPVMLITNGTAEDYNIALGGSTVVCTVPGAPEEYSFLRPLLGYLPGALLSSYVADLHKEPYFRGSSAPQWASGCGTSTNNSKIEIV